MSGFDWDNAQDVPTTTLVRAVLLYGTGYRWRRPDGAYAVLDPAEVEVFMPADTPETTAEAERRGHAAGAAATVARLRALAEMFHPAGTQGKILRDAVAHLERETTDHA